MEPVVTDIGTEMGLSGLVGPYPEDELDDSDEGRGADAWL